MIVMNLEKAESHSVTQQKSRSCACENSFLSEPAEVFMLTAEGKDLDDKWLNLERNPPITNFNL